MPPVRSYLLQTYNVSDLTSGHSHDALPRKPRKLYEVSHLRPKLSNNETGNAKPKSEQSKKTNSNYMDLNEFLNVDNNDVNQTEPESDPDFPKPTVDLLASLLTLGKMIKNQKQMIKNQLKQQTDSTSSLPSENGLIDQESGIETSIHLQTQTFSDEASEFDTQEKETFSTSDISLTSPRSKRKVIPEDIKDKDYWNRRKRNNLAAKKSREERRKKELEILETTKHLEKENSQLTMILKRLTSRNDWLESRLLDIRSCRRTDNSIGTSSVSSSTEENGN